VVADEFGQNVKRFRQHVFQIFATRSVRIAATHDDRTYLAPLLHSLGGYCLRNGSASVGPGATALAVMPSAASSMAIVRVMLSSAAFHAA
jgi:hypothetical protein